MLEGLRILSDLDTPQGPPGWARGRVWRKGCRGFMHSLLQLHWMDGWMELLRCMLGLLVLHQFCEVYVYEKQMKTELKCASMLARLPKTQKPPGTQPALDHHFLCRVKGWRSEVDRLHFYRAMLVEIAFCTETPLGEDFCTPAGQWRLRDHNWVTRLKGHSFYQNNNSM